MEQTQQGQTLGTNQQQNTNQSQTQNSINPTALILSRAIRQVENTGYDKTIIEPNGTSSWGAYGWNGNNFQDWAKQYGLNPEDKSETNQDHLAYLRINSLLNQGIPQSQIAAIWNGAKMVNGQYQAINPAYPEKVKKAYEEQLNSSTTTPTTSNNSQALGNFTPPSYTSQQQQTSQTPGLGTFTPQPYTPTTDTTSATPTTQTPGFFQSLVQSVADPFIQIGRVPVGLAAQGLGALTGDKAIQQVGQQALSNQPLNAGYFGNINAAGYDANGKPLSMGQATQQAVGAGLQVAPSVIAPETLFGEGLLSTVGRNALLGYLSGSGQQLSQGKNVLQAFSPNTSNIGGAIGGGTLSGVASGVGSLARTLSGLSPEIQNALREGTITPAEKLAYETAAKTRAGVGGLRSPSPLTLAADQVDNAAKQIDNKVASLGKQVDEAKSKLSSVPIGDIKPIIYNFKNEALNRFGIDLGYDKLGNPILNKVAGRTSPLTNSDENYIKDIWSKINNAQGQSARNTSDVIKSLDNTINYSKANGNGFSPLESFFYGARNDLDQQLRSVSPDIASVNDKFSAMSNLQNEINKMAGGQNQKGELLLKRIFSGDKSGDVQNLFQKIQDVTGIDLVKHAALARYATEAFGNSIDKSLLQQMASGVQGIQSGGVLPTLFNIAKGTAQKTFASPQRVASSLIANTKPGILSKLGVIGGINAGLNLYPQNQQPIQ